MDQRTLADAVSDASLLGLALNERTARLHVVCGAIAHAWVQAAPNLPLADALECARNAVACMTANVGMAHVAYDAINYRRSQPTFYPAWQHISRPRSMALATIALGVWCGKGWRL